MAQFPRIAVKVLYHIETRPVHACASLDCWYCAMICHVIVHLLFFLVDRQVIAFPVSLSSIS